MSFLIGLTGSIGMGKSTTAKLFAAEGCDVWDADAAVHRMYGIGGSAVVPLSGVFPEATRDGTVSRDVLKQILAEDPTALPRIEAIVHPLVADDRQAFVANATSDIVVLDIPLLFEGCGSQGVDATVVVTAPAEIQRARVMSRGTMTEAQFEMILSKQLPDAEKRQRATYVVLTDTVEHAKAQVAAIVSTIRQGLSNA
jgi:dephospho-CoA kinase